ncbi:hypothetical protein PAMA_007432 [Pampus argenteus]
MVPLKRRKVISSPVGKTDKVTKFPQIVLFLLERKMGASRRDFLRQLGQKKGFRVEETFSESVTHLISESNSGDEVRMWLHSLDGGGARTPVHLLDISWYTESMRAGHPVKILDRHKLKEQQTDETEVVLFSCPSYACQRRTSLENHNTILTDALSLLAENAELSDDEGRALAFRRAAAVLKALDKPVTDVTQLRGLPGLGEHSLTVIKEVLENGTSSEVESTKHSVRYKTLKLFTGIFGVGVKTADRWFRGGIRSLHQLKHSMLSRAQQTGLDHYDDLNQSVTKAEADAISEIVEKAVLDVLPGAQITLTGGFRRGKLTGHDVDLLITHPEEGREQGLMAKVVSWLQSRGFLLYQTTIRNSYLEAKDSPARPASNIDRFEKCFSIFRLSKGEKHGTKQPETLIESGEKTHSHTSNEIKQNKPWRAVRVDLVVSPISQFGFALLGWTGSKLFERELRRWAGQKAMSLSSHALYDNKQRRYLRVTTEEEIFAHLGLEFIPPTQRNA